MLTDAAGRIYAKVIILQCALVIGITGLAWGWKSSMAAISALLGGMVVVAGSLVYVFIARQSKVTAVSAKQVFTRHVLAEGAKIFIVLALLLALMATNAFNAGWLLAAMGVALLGHWLALLIIK